MMLNEVLQELEDNVRIISPDRQYWFVRTYSGKLFEDFVDREYIGLGYNNVPYQYIRAARSNESEYYKQLHDYLINTEQLGLSEATKWANQLINFEHNLSIDDIVIIPGEGSARLAIGEVVGDTYVSEEQGVFNFKDRDEPFPQKRKRIKWLKVINRYEFLGDISAVLRSHQAMSNITYLGDTIEGNLSSVFFREDFGFFNIKINQDEEINAFELNRFLTSITYFYKEICEEMGLDDNEDLTIKIKVQSKGGAALKGILRGGVVGVAVIFAMSKNPNVQIDLGSLLSLEASSEGLLPAITEFLDAKVERRQKLMQLRESSESLEADLVGEGMDADDEGSQAEAPLIDSVGTREEAIELPAPPEDED